MLTHASAARSLPGVAIEEIAAGLFEIKRGADLSMPDDPALRDDLPLLGRNAEMAQLKAAVAMMREEGRPVVAWIGGPPGIGGRWAAGRRGSCSKSGDSFLQGSITGRDAMRSPSS